MTESQEFTVDPNDPRNLGIVCDHHHSILFSPEDYLGPFSIFLGGLSFDGYRWMNAYHYLLYKVLKEQGLNTYAIQTQYCWDIYQLMDISKRALEKFEFEPERKEVMLGINTLEDLKKFMSEEISHFSLKNSSFKKIIRHVISEFFNQPFVHEKIMHTKGYHLIMCSSLNSMGLADIKKEKFRLCEICEEYQATKNFNKNGWGRNLMKLRDQQPI